MVNIMVPYINWSEYGHEACSASLILRRKIFVLGMVGVGGGSLARYPGLLGCYLHWVTVVGYLN